MSEKGEKEVSFRRDSPPVCPLAYLTRSPKTQPIPSSPQFFIISISGPSLTRLYELLLSHQWDATNVAMECATVLRLHCVGC